jgi:hypothetical protein
VAHEWRTWNGEPRACSLALSRSDCSCSGGAVTSSDLISAPTNAKRKRQPSEYNSGGCLASAAPDFLRLLLPHKAAPAAERGGAIALSRVKPATVAAVRVPLEASFRVALVP